MTAVLEPAVAAALVAARRAPFADAPWEGVTRRQLQNVGVGPGWRCLVAAAGPSITGWLEMAVGEAARPLATVPDDGWRHGTAGAVLEVDTAGGGVPEGWFDLVLVRLGEVHVLDRAATLDWLLAAVRPGGWIVVEDDVDLPFQLPGPAAGAATPAAVAQAVRAAAELHAVELEWARRVPVRLRARGFRFVSAEAHCTVWPGGATTVVLSGHEPAPGGGDGAPGDLPFELEPFSRLLLNPFQGGLVPPALAAGSHVLFTTCARR